MGTNTEFCFDVNGSEEFKCACYAGFYGTRCEDAEEFCPLKCGNNGLCKHILNEANSIKELKCECPFPFEGKKQF